MLYFNIKQLRDSVGNTGCWHIYLIQKLRPNFALYLIEGRIGTIYQRTLHDEEVAKVLGILIMQQK